MNIIEIRETFKRRVACSALGYQLEQEELELPITVPILGMSESTYSNIGMDILAGAIQCSPRRDVFPYTAIGRTALEISLKQPPTDSSSIRAKQLAVTELMGNPKLHHELESLVRGNTVENYLRQSNDSLKEFTGNHEHSLYRLMVRPDISLLEQRHGVTLDLFYHGLRKFIFQMLTPKQYDASSEYLKTQITALSALREDNIAYLVIHPQLVKHADAYNTSYAESLRNACLNSHKLVDAIESLARIDEILGLTQYAQNLVPPICFPTVDEAPSHFFEAKDLRNPAFSIQGIKSEHIGNDVQLGGSIRLTFITGSVSAGKSYLVRGILLTHRLAQTGSAIPAIYCRMSIPDYIGYSGPMNNQLGDNEGRFGTEVIQAASRVYKSTPKSINVFDELFEATNEEGKNRAVTRLMRFYDGLGGITILVAHNTKVIQRFSDWGVGQFWQMGFEDGKPTRKIKPGISTESYSDRLAERYGFTEDAISEYVKKFGKDLSGVN